MLKKILTITTLIFIVSSGRALASTNFLNSVVLEKNDDGYEVLLRTDNLAKVKKSIQSSDKVVLTINDVSTASDFNTMYKNTSDVSNIVVENVDTDTVKVYIQAPDVAKADVLFDTPNSAPIAVGDHFAGEKITWSVISLFVLLMIMKSSKNVKTGNLLYDLHQQVVREREMEMYANFKQELKQMPSINYNLNKHSQMSRNLRHNETIRTIKNSKQLTRI